MKMDGCFHKMKYNKVCISLKITSCVYYIDNIQCVQETIVTIALTSDVTSKLTKKKKIVCI